MNRWIVTLFLFWSCIALPEGGESKGKNGSDGLHFRLFEGIELLSKVRLWDKVQFEKEFLPTEQPCYKNITPQLDRLAKKLPRFSHRLKKILTRAINPTWYFVGAPLKEGLEQPQSDLILSYEGVRIALHDGQTVRFHETTFKKMTPDEQAWSFVHEALRTAVEVTHLQDSKTIALLTALVMHQNIDKFETKELAKRLIFILEGSQAVDGYFQADTQAEKDLYKMRTRRGDSLNPTSPLVKLIEADLRIGNSHVHQWEDVSTLEDGITGATCIYDTDQCVFIDKKRHSTYWTEMAPGSEGAGNYSKTFDESILACNGLKNFAGFSDWRLPTLSELYDVKDRVQNLIRTVEHFANNLNFFLWASTSPSASAWSVAGETNPKKGWGISLATGQMREFDKKAENSYRCIRDDYSRNWEEASVDRQRNKTTCSLENGTECAVQHKRSKLFWSVPGAQFTPLYGKTRYADDLGYVSLRTAANVCRSLDWVGLKGWRLPLPDEVVEAAADGLFGWSMKNEAFGLMLGSFWSYDPDAVAENRTKAYSIEAETFKVEFDNPRYQGLRRYICVNDTLNNNNALKIQKAEAK